MKKFLAIYIGTAAALDKSEWNKMDEAKRKAAEASGINAWEKWMMANKTVIVDQGCGFRKILPVDSGNYCRLD